MKSLPLVYLIDDNDDFSESSARLISSIGLNTVRFKSGSAFLEAINVETPGCVIVNLGKPDLEGMRVLDEMARMPLVLPAIVLTDKADIPSVVRAARHGVVAFLQKHHAANSEILDAIQSALKQDQRQRKTHARHKEIRERFTALKPGEKEVLELLLRGDELLVIAKKLNVSRRTVELRRSRFMKQLGVISFPALIALAAEHGIFPSAR